MKLTWAFLYLFFIVLSNWLASTFGLVHFLGLVVPAGAFVVGLTFTVRDRVQIYWGKNGCWVWMLVGTGLSALFSPGLAVASGVAFFISETVDWLVFTWVGGSFRKRVVLSNITSIPLDSLVFVPLVFGWNTPAIIGQSVVKLVSSLILLGKGTK